MKFNINNHLLLCPAVSHSCEVLGTTGHSKAVGYAQKTQQLIKNLEEGVLSYFHMVLLLFLQRQYTVHTHKAEYGCKKKKVKFSCFL